MSSHVGFSLSLASGVRGFRDVSQEVVFVMGKKGCEYRMTCSVYQANRLVSVSFTFL